jgi:hypothetical protein
MKQKQLFEREVAMNLVRIIRVSAVAVGLGFVTLVPRVCHAQAEINPDFYDVQPLTHPAVSVEHHAVTKPTHASQLPNTQPDCKNGSGEKSGCSAAAVPVRTRRANPSLNAKTSRRSSAAPNTTITSKADTQPAEKSAGE